MTRADIKERLRDEWRTRFCPKCSAAPGEQCRGPRGGLRKAVHRERVAFASRPNPLLSPPPSPAPNPRLEEVFNSAIRSVELLYRAQIRHFSQRCESPIEELFAASIVLQSYGARVIGVDMMTLGCDFDKEVRVSPFDATDVYIQAQVGAYRVDFLFDDRWMGKRRFFVVELDGHDWHERTKAQAARDKKRDRTLVTAGYCVMRFTGSEVFADPAACLHEVIEAILAARDAA